MEKLISELTRLYLRPHTLSAQALEQHMRGATTLSTSLAGEDGSTRAIVIAFPKVAERDEGHHWTALCALANALQSELGFPAPAVSVSGADAFGLWLSLATPVPVATAQEFLALVRKAYIPDIELSLDAASAPAELPPCLHRSSGRWAAFIHPGLGASFADEPGLEMAPPLGGQVAFLEGLQSISEAQFAQALAKLRQAHGIAPPVSLPASGAAVDGLLLKDATLEDIVRFLHSKNIEPTFRHLLPSHNSKVT